MTRKPAPLLLTGLLLFVAGAGFAAVSMDMMRETQLRKDAPVCAGTDTSGCLLRDAGHVSGPDETEESAGDRYYFHPDSRSDDPDGELVGVEDPDGGGLVRSERFRLRERTQTAGPVVGPSLLENQALTAGQTARSSASRIR